ncbi:MAG: hypothetical protein WAK16_01950 [Candidatus Cybelea sp.]
MRRLVNVDLLTIDGLVVSPSDARHLRIAVERELRRLLESASTPRAPVGQTSVRQVSAPAFGLAVHDTPATIGKRVARAVAAGIKEFG